MLVIKVTIYQINPIIHEVNHKSHMTNQMTLIMRNKKNKFTDKIQNKRTLLPLNQAFNLMISQIFKTDGSKHGLGSMFCKLLFFPYFMVDPYGSFILVICDGPFILSSKGPQSHWQRNLPNHCIDQGISEVILNITIIMTKTGF